jgi:hypothetical protein
MYPPISTTAAHAAPNTTVLPLVCEEREMGEGEVRSQLRVRKISSFLVQAPSEPV